MDTMDTSDRDRYAEDWQRDYETRYATTGRAYDDFEPHYRWGHDLAQDERYRGRSWDEVEPEARQSWVEAFQERWDDFKGAIRCGWESLTGQESGRRAA